VCRVGNGGLLELVVQAFALGDLEGIADPFVIRPESQQARDEGFVGAVAFTGARKGAVELEDSGLRGPAHQATGQKAEAAGAGGVGGGGADHYGADYVQQAYHPFLLSRELPTEDYQFGLLRTN